MQIRVRIKQFFYKFWPEKAELNKLIDVFKICKFIANGCSALSGCSIQL